MVRAEVLRKRLNKLDEYLACLYRIRNYSYNDFVADPEHYASAERFLHLAIEALIDMGNHVIADLDMGIVNTYSDIPSIIAEKGFMSAAMKEQWIQMIGFRNTLVHDYIDIDRAIVYAVLQNNLDDIEKLKKVFAAFM